MSSDPSAYTMVLVHVGYGLLCAAFVAAYSVGYLVCWIYQKLRGHR